jgi:hypothetical protein
MRIALGLRPHSGWAALIALAAPRGELELVERRRIELVEPGDEVWAKQPYHAAEGIDPGEARELVQRAIASARRTAVRELRAAAKRAALAGHEVAGCAVLVSDPLPAWSVAEILAVHFRMHKAEGVMWREALADAAQSSGLPLVALREKDLPELAAAALAKPAAALEQAIAALGRAAGPPWARDQKYAALAAWVALAPKNGAGRPRATDPPPPRAPS